MGDVLHLPDPNDPSKADVRGDVERLTQFAEKLDEGMKLMIAVITDLQVRLRKLELAERKRERILRPVVMSDLKGMG